MVKTVKTFRSADGRRVKARVTDDQIADRILLHIAEVLMPIIMILSFAVAAGIIC